MTCHKVQDLITPFLDNRLSGDVMLEVKSHLSSCPQCSEEYELLRQVRLLLGSLKVHQPSQSAECRFIQLLGESLEAPSGADKRFVVGQLLSMSTFVFSIGSNSIARQQAIAVQRSRRVAAAMAISAFGILVIASPFGSEVSHLSARALNEPPSSTASMLRMVSIPGEMPVDLSSVTVAPMASPSVVGYLPQSSLPNGYNGIAASPPSQVQQADRSIVIDQRPFSTNITFASFPSH